jgi:hypothetical protein
MYSACSQIGQFKDPRPLARPIVLVEDGQDDVKLGSVLEPGDAARVAEHADGGVGGGRGGAEDHDPRLGPGEQEGVHSHAFVCRLARVPGKGKIIDLPCTEKRIGDRVSLI